MTHTFRPLTAAAVTLPLLLAVPVAWAQTPDAPVGERPPESRDQPDVAGVFEERGLLTPKGDWVVEPSLQYVHSSSTNVAIDGFTILPAIAIGLLNISEVQRDTLTTSLALRYGLSERVEVGLRLPYVWREESLRQRELLVGGEDPVVADSSGHGLGDVELGLHLQFNRAVTGKPFFIGNLRMKSPTGTSPYEVERVPAQNPDGTDSGLDILREQPTGSGFWAFQPSLTMIYPTDPAVIYGNISYLWNVERNQGEEYGRIDPGDALGLSLGTGISLNNRTSISLGYDHSMVFKTEREGVSLDPAFERIQVGSFIWGLSQRLSPRTSLNLSVAVGATSAAPDTQVSLR
ncbi:MAG: transporter, partial [Ectothiorhodospira sp.]